MDLSSNLTFPEYLVLLSSEAWNTIKAIYYSRKFGQKHPPQHLFRPTHTSILFSSITA